MATFLIGDGKMGWEGEKGVGGGGVDLGGFSTLLQKLSI
jgi:hypothetical protein